MRVITQMSRSWRACEICAGLCALELRLLLERVAAALDKRARNRRTPTPRIASCRVVPTSLAPRPQAQGLGPRALRGPGRPGPGRRTGRRPDAPIRASRSKNPRSENLGVKEFEGLPLSGGVSARRKDKDSLETNSRISRFLLHELGACPTRAARLHTGRGPGSGSFGGTSPRLISSEIHPSNGLWDC